MAKLNSGFSTTAFVAAGAELAKDRSEIRFSPILANQDVYQLLKDGVKVTYRPSEDEEAIELVKVID